MLALPAVIPQLDTVHHCRAEDLLTALPSGYVDLIVTSPPYDNLRTYKGFAWDFEYIARQSYRVLKPGGVLVWVVGDATIDGSETLTSFEQALYFRRNVGFNMHDTMIYQKTGSPFPDQMCYCQVAEYMFVLSKGRPDIANLIRQKSTGHGGGVLGTRQKDGTFKPMQSNRGLGTRPLDNVWRIHHNNGTGDIAHEHPAVFPEELAERHILSWSNPGDIVLDYFGGSGTTAKMARINNRRFLTCDISADYCELMRKRLAQPFTPNMFEVA